MVFIAFVALAACGGNPDPVASPPADPFPGAVTPPSGGGGGNPPPAPPRPPADVPPLPTDPGISADPLAGKTPEEINAASPLQPAYFGYDSDDLDDGARQVLTENAKVLQRYAAWIITIEGHCDERGTPEYNLALGDRRALAAKTFLLSLGISADRIRTVSYGKEFPFDPGHDEGAWARNRRAHFMVVSK
jgi:peptidoglycan-associated lipoprotein